MESLCRPPRQARQLSTINQTTAKQTNGVFSEDQRANLVAGRDLLEIALRRSRRLTHFCSVRVTHLENRILVGAHHHPRRRRVRLSAKVRVRSISSALKARSVRGLCKERRSYRAGVERWSLLRRCRKYSGPT